MLEEADVCLVGAEDKMLNRVKGHLLHIAVLFVMMNGWCTLSKSTELCSQNEYRLLHMNYDPKCPETSFLEKIQH